MLDGLISWAGLSISFASSWLYERPCHGLTLQAVYVDINVNIARQRILRRGQNDNHEEE